MGTENGNGDGEWEQGLDNGNWNGEWERGLENGNGKRDQERDAVLQRAPRGGGGGARGHRAGQSRVGRAGAGTLWHVRWL